MSIKYMKFCFLFYISTACLLVSGQNDYRKGYIITNDNDTLIGYLEYGNIKTLGNYCFFKTDSLSNVKKYTPNDISGFRFNDSKCFISKKIEIDGIPQMQFLEYLVNGIIDLYFYVDQLGYDYYFIQKDGRLVELSNKEKIIAAGDKQYLTGKDKYKGILLYFTKEAPEIKPLINKMDFNNKSFINIAEQYHNSVCDSVDCITYTKTGKRLNDTKWVVKIGLSLNLSRVNLSLNNKLSYYGPSVSMLGYQIPNYESEILNSNFGDDYGSNIIKAKTNYYYPGVYVNISPNWRSSFQVEFWYKELEFNFNNTSLKFKNISFPIMFKREFLYYNKLSPFITAGISINKQLNATLSNINIEYTYPNETSDTIVMINNSIQLEDYNFINLHYFNLGIIYGIGVSYDMNNYIGLKMEIRGNNSNYYMLREALSPLIYNESSIKLFEYGLLISSYIKF